MIAGTCCSQACLMLLSLQLPIRLYAEAIKKWREAIRSALSRRDHGIPCRSSSIMASATIISPATTAASFARPTARCSGRQRLPRRCWVALTHLPLVRKFLPFCPVRRVPHLPLPCIRRHLGHPRGEAVGLPDCQHRGERSRPSAADHPPVCPGSRTRRTPSLQAKKSMPDLGDVVHAYPNRCAVDITPKEISKEQAIDHTLKLMGCGRMSRSSPLATRSTTCR